MGKIIQIYSLFFVLLISNSSYAGFCDGLLSKWRSWNGTFHLMSEKYFYNIEIDPEGSELIQWLAKDEMKHFILRELIKYGYTVQAKQDQELELALFEYSTVLHKTAETEDEHASVQVEVHIKRQQALKGKMIGIRKNFHETEYILEGKDGLRMIRQMKSDQTIVLFKI